MKYKMVSEYFGGD